MKQHAIPQNILDIEFKLFTKFTVREFAYMAVGIGFGAIFLFSTQKNGGSGIPAILSIPLFLLCSGLGLFFGLIPINGQSADTFIANYIKAITKPTRRVWKNKDFDDKFATQAKERGLDVTKGSMSRNKNEENKGKAEIAGGTSIPANQFIQDSQISAIDSEEAAKLQQIEKVMQETGVAPTQPISRDPQDQQAQTTPVQQGQTSIGPQVTAQPVQPTTAQTETQPTVEKAQPPQNTEIPGTTLNKTPIETQQTAKQTEKAPPPQKMAQEQQPAPQQRAASAITVTNDTAQHYALQINNYTPKPNSINIQLTDKKGKAIQQAMVMIKNQNGMVTHAQQSNQHGLVLPTKTFQPGQHNVEIKHDNYQFAPVRYILDNKAFPVIRIMSTN